MPLATQKEYIIFHTLCTKVYIILLLKENKDILQLMVEFCLHLIFPQTKIISYHNVLILSSDTIFLYYKITFVN